MKFPLEKLKYKFDLRKFWLKIFLKNIEMDFNI